MPLDEINTLTKTMETQTKKIKYDLMKMVWYMRGGISLSEAFEFGHDEKEIVNKIIEENLETTQKTKMPFF